MTYVLGVDPGVIGGYALVGPVGVVVHGQSGGIVKRKMIRSSGDDVDAVVDLVADRLPSAVHLIDVHLAIEGQFLSDDSGIRGAKRHKAVSSLKTARHAGIWIGVCQARGMPVYLHKGEPAIPDNAWRAGVWGGRWGSTQAKTHAVKMAKLHFGVEILKTHHHTAEAIWIAEYARVMIDTAARQQGLGLGEK